MVLLSALLHTLAGETELVLSFYWLQLDVKLCSWAQSGTAVA